MNVVDGAGDAGLNLGPGLVGAPGQVQARRLGHRLHIPDAGRHGPGPGFAAGPTRAARAAADVAGQDPGLAQLHVEHGDRVVETHDHVGEIQAARFAFRQAFQRAAQLVAQHADGPGLKRRQAGHGFRAHPGQFPGQLAERVVLGSGLQHVIGVARQEGITPAPADRVSAVEQGRDGIIGEGLEGVHGIHEGDRLHVEGLGDMHDGIGAAARRIPCCVPAQGGPGGIRRRRPARGPAACARRRRS